ncbi:MAG: hypothetical protein RQ758_00660 [Methanomicrobiaceae archaeon]|nr:hypothetical protein [Methanomicrobiaceae archaeon]
MMKIHWSAPLLLAALVGTVQAAPPLSEQDLSSTDFIIILLAGIVLINLFLVLLYKILHREVRPRQRSSLYRVFGLFAGFGGIVFGSMLVVYDILVIITELNYGSFAMASRVLFFYFQGVPPVYAIIITGALGLLLFLIGVYFLTVLHITSLMADPHGMPTVSGATEKTATPAEEDAPLNPVLQYRVITREEGKPAPDVKVILKERGGIRFHAKYTDFDGYVTFEGVEGYSHDHYAYVEGDEDRIIFRVMQL